MNSIDFNQIEAETLVCTANGDVGSTPKMSNQLGNIIEKSKLEILEQEAQKKYIKALNKGMLKVMSKMGISTFQSYCGAQIFDAVGLSQKIVDRYFIGTSTKVEGISSGVGSKNGSLKSCPRPG